MYWLIVRDPDDQVPENPCEKLTQAAVQGEPQVPAGAVVGAIVDVAVGIGVAAEEGKGVAGFVVGAMVGEELAAFVVGTAVAGLAVAAGEAVAVFAIGAGEAVAAFTVGAGEAGEAVAGLAVAAIVAGLTVGEVEGEVVGGIAETDVVLVLRKYWCTKTPTVEEGVPLQSLMMEGKLQLETYQAHAVQ